MDNKKSILGESLLFRACHKIFIYISDGIRQSAIFSILKNIFICALKIADKSGTFLITLAKYYRGSVIHRILSFRLDRWRG